MMTIDRSLIIICYSDQSRRTALQWLVTATAVTDKSTDEVSATGVASCDGRRVANIFVCDL